MDIANKVAHTVSNVAEAAEVFTEKMTDAQVEAAEQDAAASSSAEGKKLTVEERQAKLEQLRNKMRSSAVANRQSLVEESQKQKLGAKEQARLDRQRKLAETLRLKADAEERGEDVERQKNWEYTIEENDEWEKKKARKARRADFEFHDDAHAARRKYKKDLDYIKPNLEAYNRQKEIALGLAPGTLVKQGEGSSTSTESVPKMHHNVQLVPTTEEQRRAAEMLYRDANTLLYADNKPSEEAIDRVVEKLNRDIDKKRKFSRKRANEDEGDITYINERNRVFNKKIARFYDKYTAEIRASFERGTAL
ncbi:SYF2-domain-containing protein [Heliocybe sulcata]|uniref:Pre-mRNA-splicing factor SYF2 n=1 Tax=Heliocybe sulcata TaxID=5364 RepID=A0A5C3N7L6_9AGAM|nr:SYF2-domain-containing protein [Heliocybe sulcata]